jgi:hypothetical protein
MWIKETDYAIFKSSDFGNLELSVLRFALFDLDGTLITSKNGHNPKILHTDKDPKNYVYLFDKDKYFKTFQMLKDCGFIIGIITNQSRINYRPSGSKSCRLSESEAFKESVIFQKIENILNDFQSILGWKPYVVINITRVMLKPSPKSFELIISQIETQNIIIKQDEIKKEEILYTVLDYELVVPNIFYVGDACGSDDDFIPYRFSSVDKDFVSHINEKYKIDAKFIRAKDFFKTQSAKIESSKIDDSRELVLLIGNPGSGKSSTAYRFQEAGYKIVISDDIKDKKKMLSFVEFYMNQNKSIVVDALNHTRETRDLYIKISKKYDFKIRILWHIRDGRCFNALRGLYEKEYYGKSVYIHDKPVSDVVYNVYSSKFEEPKISEGTIELIY